MRASLEVETERFGYSWRLPSDWTFVSPDLFWKSPPVAGVDVYAAKTGPRGRVLLSIATDVIAVVPGKHPGDDPRDCDGLVVYAEQVLRIAGATPSDTQRISMFGVPGVQVTGSDEHMKTSIRLLYRGYRRFEFRCFDLDKQAGFRCAPALDAFEIADLPEPAAEENTPQVRHLRDERLGLAFDAPDDTWLSHGPHRGGHGAQLVWTWTKAGRQIDVQVMDLDELSAQPDQATLARGMADSTRHSGNQVIESEATFADVKSEATFYPLMGPKLAHGG